MCCNREVISKVQLARTLDGGISDGKEIIIAKSGMIQYKLYYRLWPCHRIGNVDRNYSENEPLEVAQ